MNRGLSAQDLQEEHHGGVARIDHEIDVEGCEEGMDGAAKRVEETLEALDARGRDIDAADAGNGGRAFCIVIAPAIDGHILGVIADKTYGQFFGQSIEPSVIGGNTPGADDGDPEGGMVLRNDVAGHIQRQLLPVISSPTTANILIHIAFVTMLTSFALLSSR